MEENLGCMTLDRAEPGAAQADHLPGRRLVVTSKAPSCHSSSSDGGPGPRRRARIRSSVTVGWRSLIAVKAAAGSASNWVYGPGGCR